MTDVLAAGLPVADPTESERRVWAAFARGEQVDLRAQDAEADDPRRAETWDASRRVRAEVVAALWLGAVNSAAGRVSGLRLAGAVVEGAVDVRGGIINCPIEMTGCCFTGAVVLAETRTRTIDLSGSVLDTIDAVAAEFGGHLILQHCQAAEVSLDLAHISGQLDLTGAKLANPGGNALHADRATVDGNMYCREGFQAEGKVRLAGAHISGQLLFGGASLHADLTLYSLQAESLWLNDMADIGPVNLASAQVKVLYDPPGFWPPRMRLDGFIYESLQPYAEVRGAAGRLAWLAHAEPDYCAQPYEQLAAYYRRLGHDEDARRVLLAKQRRRRATLGPVGKLTGYVLDGIVGYGYRPGRAFTWLVLLLAAGSVYFSLNRPAPINLAQHPHYQPVLYTADLLIPLVNLGQSNVWAPAGAGQWAAAALVGLGWVLVTAAVAGITRVLARV